LNHWRIWPFEDIGLHRIRTIFFAVPFLALSVTDISCHHKGKKQDARQSQQALCLVEFVFH
jgi:hypothetical protein